MVQISMEGIRDRGSSYQAMVQCQDHTGTMQKKAKSFKKSQFNSPAEALSFAQKWRTDSIRKIKKGLWSEEDAVGFKDGITMEQAFQEVHKSIWNGTTTKASTAETYVNHFQTFLKFTGPGSLIKDVAKYKYLLDFRTALMNDEIKGVRPGTSTSTFNRILTSIYAFLDYCKNVGYIDSLQPLPDKATLRLKEVNLEKRAPSNDEGQQMLIQCRSYPDKMFRLVYADIIEFCMNSAFRSQEVLTMKKKHYVYDDGVAYAVVTKERAKTGKERRVVLTARARQILDLHTQGKGKDDFVFCKEDNKPITKHALRHCFDTLKNFLGLGPEVTFHSTRHFAITKMEREFGLSTSQIMRMVGHTNISTTQKYISKQPDDDLIIKQKMDEKQITLQLVGGGKA